MANSSTTCYATHLYNDLSLKACLTAVSGNKRVFKMYVSEVWVLTENAQY